MAGVTLGVSVALLTWVTQVAPAGEPRPEVVPALRATALALAAVVVIAALLHRRATGQVRGMLVAAAALGWAATALLDLSAGTGLPTGALALLRIVVSIAAALFLGHALWGPDVHTGLRPTRLALVATWSVAGLWGVLSLTLVGWWGSASAVAGGHLLLAALWALVGIIGLVRAIDRRCVLIGWVSWTALAVALAEAMRFLSWMIDSAWLVDAATVRVCGLLIAAVGSVLSITRLAIGRRTDLLTVELHRRRTEAETQSDLRERRHEIGNALTAIEGATLTLERHKERLSTEDRELLEHAVLSGIEHLRRLVFDEDRSRAARLPLARALDPEVQLARSRGLAVQVNGDADGEVHGDLTSLRQVLANLLANAERHGGCGDGRPVRIDVRRDGELVEVRVVDDGPGVPDGFEELVFEPGVRLNDSARGEGLGLHVARRLMLQLGGDLTYDAHDGGACFVMTCRAGGSSSGDVGTNELHDVR